MSRPASSCSGVGRRPRPVGVVAVAAAGLQQSGAAGHGTADMGAHAENVEEIAVCLESSDIYGPGGPGEVV